MDVGLLLRVAGVGLIVTVMHQILSKSGREEQAMLVSLTGVVLILLMLVGEIANLLSAIRTAFGL